MANPLPSKLKSADIARFAQRAAQLETAKPAIAYWCEYWIVNQLLARGLHNTDAECLRYTTTLMDKLEQTKAKYATDDAIMDDTAGQAYVEQFGLETFERADRAVQANKVTKQTADTFLAASTFLELLNIWGEPEQEIIAKIRYAKWNALRIVKALKEGKDPNESNPKPEPDPKADLVELDPNDPEVQELSGQLTKSRQASVEEVTDEQDRVEAHLAAQSTLDRSLHPSAQPSARGSPRPTQPFDPYPKSGFPYSALSKDNEVSPVDTASNDRDGSVGGGYFPEVPTFTSDTHPPTLPTAPADDADEPLHLPDPSKLPPPGKTAPADFSFATSPSVDKAVSPTPPQDFYRQAPPPQNYNPPHPPASVIIPAATQPPAKRSLITDDVAIAKAQKHARWAISALNFEDADTAVKELRAALQTLGAQ